MDVMEKKGSKITPKCSAWQHAVSLLMGRQFGKIDTLNIWKMPLRRNQQESVDGQISQRKKNNT